ncbi:MAG TPA: SH3 domain-containing protein [Thermoanaerobaculia bacterium]|nr:SH3 domain-containing protein [Thermoanaerobaculia bacterium]
MRPLLVLLSLIVVCHCAAPPAPVEPPATPAPPPPAATAEEQVLGSVRVTASALNVRRDASTDAEVLAQVKKGTELSVLREDESWMKVRLADGTTGWVAARFVSSGNAPRQQAAKRKAKSGCPADSDYAFLETPQLRGSDRSATGLVVVEATVNTKGVVTATKVISNGTGDETLAFLAEREIRSAKFSPPIRNCVPRAFIFTYRRTF